MRNILVILFLLLSSIAFSQKQVIKKYDNGNVDEIGHINEKGLRDSTWTKYNVNGLVIGLAHYKDGLKIGTWKIYREDGVLLYEINYENGIRKGLSKQYNELGEIVAVKEY